MENPYLEELKALAYGFNKKIKLPAGFPKHIRERNRARNYRARASRKFNRLRAKGK